jgi:hypothetical protein
VNDYLLHEMARLRIDELHDEAARSRAAEKARGARGRGLGLLGGLWSARAENGGLSHGTTREVCCA